MSETITVPVYSSDGEFLFLSTLPMDISRLHYWEDVGVERVVPIHDMIFWHSDYDGPVSTRVACLEEVAPLLDPDEVLSHGGPRGVVEPPLELLCMYGSRHRATIEMCNREGWGVPEWYLAEAELQT